MGPTVALFQNIESHTDTGPCNSCNAPWYMKKNGHGKRKPVSFFTCAWHSSTLIIEITTDTKWIL